VDALEELTAIAVEQGREDLADLLRRERARPPSAGSTVLVAGETKRGKSSLVNALLGRPGLSPVAASVCTATHLVFRYGSREAATARVHGADHPVALDALGEWIGADAVDVTLDHPLLADGLVLVDTPGVGGLESAHGQITLAALERADALLFVADAGAPLSRPELAFLERAAEWIATVLLVITKVDAHAGWRTIADEDRALLARHAPRFAHVPLLPVSSELARLAGDARAAGDEALAAELREESGLPALERALRERVLDRARHLSDANSAQLALGVLQRLRAVDTATQQTRAHAVVRDATAESRARLEQLKRDAAAWQPEMAFAFQRLTMDLEARFDTTVAELQHRFEHQVAESEADLEPLVAELETELRALEATLDAEAERGLRDIAARTVAQLGLDEADLRLAEVARGGPLAQIATPAPAAAPAGPTLLETIPGSAMLVVFGARGLDLLLPGSGVALQLAGAAVGGAMAAGVAGVRRRRTNRAAQRAHALRLVSSALGPHARNAIRQPLRERLFELRHELNATLKRCVDARAAELAEETAAQRRLAEADAAQVAVARAEARRRLDRMKRLEAQLLGVVHAAPEQPSQA